MELKEDPFMDYPEDQNVLIVVEESFDNSIDSPLRLSI